MLNIVACWCSEIIIFQKLEIILIDLVHRLIMISIRSQNDLGIILQTPLGPLRYLSLHRLKIYPIYPIYPFFLSAERER